MTMKVSTLEPWVGTAEIAVHLGKPESFFHNRAADLGIPRVKVGNHWRYKVSQVDAWLAAGGVA